MDSSIASNKEILYKHSEAAKKYFVTVITRCLTDRCEDCTGSYSNDILNHVFICKHKCHLDRRNSEEAPTTCQ
jgi:hypothetical protein